jgi:phosphomannomutase
VISINPSTFREYDIRAIAGRDTPETAEQIARAYATFLRSRTPNPDCD